MAIEGFIPEDEFDMGLMSGSEESNSSDSTTPMYDNTLDPDPTGNMGGSDTTASENSGYLDPSPSEEDPDFEEDNLDVPYDREPSILSDDFEEDDDDDNYY